MGGHPVVIERAGAEALGQVRPLTDLHDGREDLLAETVEQEGCLAVKRATAGRGYEVAEQRCRQRCLEQHRHFAGLDLARTEARFGTPRAMRPISSADISSRGSRRLSYQSSRCMPSDSPAITEQESEWREVAKPPMNPRLFADTNCDCWVEAFAPSELVILLLVSNAACSQLRASSIAASTSSCHG